MHTSTVAHYDGNMYYGWLFSYDIFYMVCPHEKETMVEHWLSEPNLTESIPEFKFACHTLQEFCNHNCY